MVNVLSNEATDLSQNNSDINQMGMNLGNNAPVRDLDAEKREQTTTINDRTKKYEEEAEEFKKQQKENNETKQSQGQHETNLEDYYNTLDNLDKWTDSISNIDKYNHTALYEAINKMKKENLINDKWIKENINNKNQDEWKNLINKELNNHKTKTRDNINNTKNNKNYDNRTDEQKREDTLQGKREEREDSAYSRAVDDMRKAGLHPGLMFGSAGPAGSSGGSSSGSSKDKDEDDKRKKKKQRRIEEERYLAEMQAAKQRETMRLIGGMVNMLLLGGTRSVVAGTMSRAKQPDMSKYLTKNEATKAAIKQNEWNRKNYKWKDV